MPSAEDSARYILALYVDHFGRRSGECLLLKNFTGAFSKNRWRSSDFNEGIEYAINHEWVEIKSSSSFMLTELGYSIATGEEEMDLFEHCK
jgi:hypothetical protein